MFSACFVCSVATCNANAKEYNCLIWANINPESKVCLNVLFYFIFIFLFIYLLFHLFIYLYVIFGPFKISLMSRRSISRGALPGVAT